MKEVHNYYAQAVNADMVYLETREAILAAGGVELTRDSFLFNPISFAEFFKEKDIA